MVTTAVSRAHLLEALIELQPKILRLITPRVGRAAAEDLLQDLFLRVCKIGVRLQTREDAKRYLMRTAINAATDHWRVENRRTQLLAEKLAVVAADVVNPQDQLLLEERIVQVDAALAELPAKCRDVIYLSCVVGMTHAEIAEKLAVSLSLVDRYAVRAILHCRARLNGTSASDST